MNGNPVTIQIDGITSNLSGQNLISFIQSLPANVLEKMEIIDNSRVSFEANTSREIINLITHNEGIKELSGTVNYRYSVNKYQKTQPLVVLNGRIKNSSFPTNHRVFLLER
ncbi:hypothetical protein [Riemerella columbipharyngis]|uniref:Uncharacterized protein n=1 Tax=Riemerella columbipharyngis TaxID=1071918 RepID=A0A1G7AR36_9FLAO|nr:hypothetical protein [Riemerella columbipharyngis]SDE17251.1 hypothetical protein SAMN05421544_10465 [Riemerella columbipharyngis]